MTASIRNLATRLALAAAIGAAGIAFLASPVPERIGAHLMQQLDQPSPTLVIGGGTRLDLGDRTVQVYGKDQCPPNERMFDCIRLDKPKVNVTVVDTEARMHFDEVWTVTRDGSRITIARPNGHFVSQLR